MGHSQGNIDLDRYGKRYNPDILYNKCVKKIVFETSQKRGIDFLALKLDWKKILGWGSFNNKNKQLIYPQTPSVLF